MRILSSPFEATRETLPADAADKVREDKAAAISPVEAPAATTDIQAGIDSSTKQSLGRLALLIRDATVKSVGEQTEEKSNGSEPGETEEKSSSENAGDETPQKEAPSTTVKPMRAFSIVAPIAAVAPSTPTEPTAQLKAIPPLEESLKDAFPAVIRLEKHLQSAARKRGAKIYSQQKTKDAVELILGELDRRKAS